MWFRRKTPKTTKNSSASDSSSGVAEVTLAPQVQVLKHAQAMRVMFFYPGEEGTYVENAMVTLFENGLVHIRAPNEETTTHVQHCEILWTFTPLEKNDGKNYEKDARGKTGGNIRLVNFKNRNQERGPEGPEMT